MYPAPPVIEASIFAKIPAYERYETEKSDFVTMQLHGAPTPSVIEGPTFDLQGNLWICDIPWGRIFRISSEGEPTLVVKYDGEPNGLAFRQDGKLFIADHKRGIVMLDPETGQVETIIGRPKLQGFKGINDLIFGTNGDLYFTDQGQTGLHDPSGCVYRLRPSGELDCILNNVPSPNGLVLNADESVLFLAATRDNAIWRVPLLPDGTTTKVGRFIQMSGGGGPDGLAIDEGGGLVVGHVGSGSFWLFDSNGEPTLRIKNSFGHLTTNCAFGGSDRKRLFMTESKSGQVLVTPMSISGALTAYESAAC